MEKMFDAISFLGLGPDMYDGGMNAPSNDDEDDVGVPTDDDGGKDAETADETTM